MCCRKALFLSPCRHKGRSSFLLLSRLFACQIIGRFVPMGLVISSRGNRFAYQGPYEWQVAWQFLGAPANYAVGISLLQLSVIVMILIVQINGGICWAVWSDDFRNEIFGLFKKLVLFSRYQFVMKYVSVEWNYHDESYRKEGGWF